MMSYECEPWRAGSHRVAVRSISTVNLLQWRRQLWVTCPSSTFNNFIFTSLFNKYDCQLLCSPRCENSWCRCQQLTALSTSTALVTRLLVIEQLLHPALKLPHDLLSSFAPPHNKSWQHHWSVACVLRQKLICHIQEAQLPQRERRPRSFKVINVDTNRKPVCDFLLVNNTNFQRFQVNCGLFVKLLLLTVDNYWG